MKEIKSINDLIEKGETPDIERFDCLSSMLQDAYFRFEQGFTITFKKRNGKI